MLKKLLLSICLVGTLSTEAALPIESSGNVVREDPLLIERILRHAKGHQEFQELHFKPNEQEFVRLIKEGQSPKTLFIACSDSRVVPELILNANPGDLFVVRTAGNFVPFHDLDIAWDGVAATIEFAVQVLGVKDVIVCGHSHCGAVAGLFQNLEGPKFTLLNKWLRFGQETKAAILANRKEGSKEVDCCSAAEQLSALYQVKHLMTYPFIKKMVEERSLSLHAWYFIIETGVLKYYSPENNAFIPLAT